jgi:RNase H-like domain found in reverse transcriptase
MNLLKTKVLRDWLIPTKKKELQSFLGFANYYRWFIKDFALHALPLNQLTSNVPWEWTDECLFSYNKIREIITSNQVLTMPNDEGQYQIECDASYYTTRAILSQKQADETWRPIAFASWTMTPAQRSYQVYDKEFLAVMNALNKWQ